MDWVDYKALSFWFHVMEVICIAGLGIYSWFSNRHKANADAIDHVEQSVTAKLGSLNNRVLSVESELKHLPTHSDIGALYDRINRVGESMSTVEGKLQQINNSLNLIHDHLLNNRNRD